MTYVVGITGSIATGKSTVSSYLISENYEVIDCDKLTAFAYIDCKRELFELFSDCFENGEINRKKLGSLIFNNPAKKKELESIIHPYVRSKMEKAIMEKEEGILFLDIPLLYEANMGDLCDEIWVVYVPAHVQLERLMKRNQLTEDEAKLRIQNQMSIEDKKDLADFVLDNQQTVFDLYAQIKERLGYINEQIK